MTEELHLVEHPQHAEQERASLWHKPMRCVTSKNFLCSGKEHWALEPQMEKLSWTAYRMNHNCVTAVKLESSKTAIYGYVTDYDLNFAFRHVGPSEVNSSMRRHAGFVALPESYAPFFNVTKLWRTEQKWTVHLHFNFFHHLSPVNSSSYSGSHYRAELWKLTVG